MMTSLDALIIALIHQKADFLSFIFISESRASVYAGSFRFKVTCQQCGGAFVPPS